MKKAVPMPKVQDTLGMGTAFGIFIQFLNP